MTRGYTVAGLLFALEAVGVTVEPNAAGDGLKLSGTGHPPADLLAEVKAMKAELLAELQGMPEHEIQEVETEAVNTFRTDKPTTTQEPPYCSSTIEGLSTEPTDQSSFRTEAGGIRPSPPTVRHWETEAAKPGRCGSCARAEDTSAEWGRYMVFCGAPSSAWWPPESTPLAHHVGARCSAYLAPGEEVGSVYSSKQAAQTWGNGQARHMPAPTGGTA